MLGLQQAKAMIAQTQLRRIQNSVNWSGCTTHFVKDEQVYKNSDRLDLPCLLVRGGVNCSTTECGCDVFINVPLMYPHFCPRPFFSAEHFMRNATHLLWILMGMAPH